VASDLRIPVSGAKGTRTPDPRLQIAGIAQVVRLELGRRQSMSDPGIPPLTGVNGTLMARRSWSPSG